MIPGLKLIKNFIIMYNVHLIVDKVFFKHYFAQEITANTWSKFINLFFFLEEFRNSPFFI